MRNDSRGVAPESQKNQLLGIEPLMTVGQAAAMLHVGRTLLYRLMEKGDLDYVKLGRTRRIHPSDLKRLISDHRIGNLE